MRSYLRLASFASLAFTGVVWLASAPTIGCGGSGTELPPEDTPTDAGVDASLDGPNDDNPICGNGFKEGIEQCDDGNDVGGDGCERDCTLSCKPGPEGDKKCNDDNPCNGKETCGPQNKCLPGTALAEGGECGTGKSCKGGLCVDATCGDGIVNGSEECDDANTTSGDGCDGCKFSCVSTDAARNCASSNPCVDNGTCDDAKHTCTAGGNKADGASCGAGLLCKGGMCVGAKCGDGVLSTGEQCDFGAANGAGTGCELDCKFSCSGTSCDDGNACNGAETCADVTVGGATGKRCAAGTPLAEGATCGTDKTCKGGACVAGSCGDGIVSGTEQCDFGSANGAGSGCEIDCKFSCSKTADACSDGNACNGTESCQTVTVGGKTGQKCGAGTPLAEGATCATGKICKSGACVTPPPVTCGNGVLDTGEECDFGAGNGAGTGCEPTCKFSCSKTADTCSDGNACNGVESCQTVTVGGKTGQKCGAGTALADCSACGTGGVCQAGACKTSTCGDGCTDAAKGEQCDFGTGNAAGSGCEPTCKFSCTKTATSDSCTDANACNGVETCGAVTVGGKAGQKCSAGTNVAKCTSCAGGLCDGAGVCKASTCGDTCIDATKGEQCDPGGTATCDATCKTITAAVCGNGKRETGEQCDDGNTKNLDGCDSTCKFEQNQRATSLDMQFATDAFCTANRLGSAIASAGQTTIRNSLNDGVKAGTTNVLFKLLNLDDLSGTADPSVTLANLGGSPVAAPVGRTYDGAASLDWWYTVDPLTIDASRNPLPGGLITGGIAAKTLNAGPGNMALLLQFSAGTVSTLNLSNVRIRAAIGATSTPTTSAGTTPGHLASENLDPALTSFATMTSGQLCGAVSAASLAKVPIPAALLSGIGACAGTVTYKATNSLLDVLVGGCRNGLFLPIINASQPDTEDPTVAPIGSGPNYTLSASSTATREVDRCRSSGTTGTTYTKGTADFDRCLQDAAYSSYFKFATNRVIIK
jgi:cysteine-rich repeat protein